MMKSVLRKILRKYGYEISRVHNGFTMNNYLKWLVEMPIKTVLDIGANEGQYASFISSIFPEASIHSFEPLEKCFSVLKQLSKANSRIHAYNFAFGDENGILPFHENEFSPSSSLLKMTEVHISNFPFTKNESICNVEVKRLDDFAGDFEYEKEVLVKIDVQGFEDRVLRGGENFIASVPVMVVLETSFSDLYENEPSFEVIFEFMKNCGYSFNGNLDQMFSPENGRILQGDAIFMRK